MRASTTTARRRALCVAAAAALLASLGGGLAGRVSPTAAAASARPNIVLIQTDDQTRALMSRRSMPQVTKLVAERGTRFSDYAVTTPICCPSRASLITGQYAHNHGVLSNDPGYPDLIDPGNVLPVWLQRAGYRTAHVGKFLNNYARPAVAGAAPAPGWDQWHTMMHPFNYYDYDLSVNGEVVHHGHHGDRDHLTEVLNRTAVRMVERYLPRSRPLYLELDEYAPHIAKNPEGHCRQAAVPGPRDVGRFEDVPLPDPPSLNEADVSDKPSFIQDLPLLSEHQLATIERHYQCALAALRTVDRGVGRVWDAVKEAGEQDDTVFVVFSDNGLYYGEHRLGRGKVEPYEEALHMPLIIRAPRSVRRGADRVPKVSEPVANIDLAPTILKLAGAEPCDAPGDCRVMDGRSLRPLLRGNESAWPEDRGLLIEYDGPMTKAGVCAYQAVRPPGRLYAEYTKVRNDVTGECAPSNEKERYDLLADPFELQSLANGPPTPAELLLAQRLDQLRDCAGIEGRDPLPPSGHYCE